jgi:hypothetical protein
MEFTTKGVLRQGYLLMNCDALPEGQSHLCTKMGKWTECLKVAFVRKCQPHIGGKR